MGRVENEFATVRQRSSIDPPGPRDACKSLDDRVAGHRHAVGVGDFEHSHGDEGVGDLVGAGKRQIDLAVVARRRPQPDG